MTRTNLERWREVQREETEAIVGPALDLAEEMRAADVEWHAVAEELNRRGYRSRTGARWTYAAIWQAVNKRRRRRQATA